MIFGIQKRQWVLLLSALSTPLLLNIVAIWQDAGSVTLRRMWEGSYPDPFVGFLGGPYNPLPEIAGKLLLFSAALGILGWSTILLSNQAFFQQQPRLVQSVELGVLSLFIALVFTVASGFFMPLIWLPMFNDYQLGIPASQVAASWCWWMVLPVTLALFIAIFASRDRLPIHNNA
jgi:hypothetical protein